jgi:predicted dehydrogenase
MIGTGDVTEIKSGPALYKSAGSSLLGVYNRTLAKAQDYARRHNVNKVYSSADDLINDRVIDAVYIATPPDSHLDYARKVIAAGKPVYIEKPLASTGAECRQIALSAAQAQVPVFTAFYRRGLARFQKVKELLDNNSLGKLKEVKILFSQPLPIDALQKKLPWRLDSSISPSGMFLDVAVHAIDILDFLLGPISVVSSIAKSLSGIS